MKTTWEQASYITCMNKPLTLTDYNHQQIITMTDHISSRLCSFTNWLIGAIIITSPDIHTSGREFTKVSWSPPLQQHSLASCLSPWSSVCIIIMPFLIWGHGGEHNWLQLRNFSVAELTLWIKRCLVLFVKTEPLPDFDNVCPLFYIISLWSLWSPSCLTIQDWLGKSNVKCDWLLVCWRYTKPTSSFIQISVA